METSQFEMPRVQITKPTINEVLKDLPNPNSELEELKNLGRIGAEMKRLEKKAQVDALSLIALNVESSNQGHFDGIVSVGFSELQSLFSQVQELSKTGVISEETATDLLIPTFELLYPLENQGMQLNNKLVNDTEQTLKINRKFASPEIPSEIDFDFTQKEGPFKGNVKVKIPMMTNDKGFPSPDYDNSKIVSQSEIFANLNFEEASELIVSSANQIAIKFEMKARETQEKIKQYRK